MILIYWCWIPTEILCDSRTTPDIDWLEYTLILLFIANENFLSSFWKKAMYKEDHESGNESQKYL